MEDDDSKTRRFYSETEDGESMLPDDQPDTKLRTLDEEMMDSTTEIDRKILVAAISESTSQQCADQSGSPK